jgi:hypothetical protein
MKYEFDVRGHVPLQVYVNRSLGSFGFRGDSSLELTSAPGSRVEQGVLSLDAGPHTLDAICEAFRRNGVAAHYREPVDLSILGLSVKNLIKALRTGKHDGSLEELLAAEAAGQNRKSALRAISTRSGQ